MKKALLVVMMAVLAGLVPVGVYAADLNPICDELEGDQAAAAGCGDSGDALTDTQIPGAISLVMLIAGVLAVGMIIYAGVRMVISQGESAKIETARKTLVYAIIGLVIVLLAYAIVGFVVGQFGGGGGGTTETEQTNE